MLLASLALLPGLSVLARAPEVVVTVKPVHALVAAVMAGHGEPALLIAGAQSPHAYSLRPSDARALGQARLIFRVGPELEGFLDRPLAALGARARIVQLMEMPGIHLLTLREGDERGGHDPHIWLDPDNARAIVAAVATVLAEADPANRRAYAANAAQLDARIAVLDAEIEALLAPVRARPYLTAHDAYRYFERHYGLNAVGAVSPTPERQPGARHLATLRRVIEASGARCLFSEPQFEPAVAVALAADLSLRRAELDPLGAALTPGPDAWFALMREIANALARCLGGGG